MDKPIGVALNKTTILLTEDEARLFLEFQKRYTFMKALEDLDVFNLKSGSVEIHFANTGEIASIDIHKHFRLS